MKLWEQIRVALCHLGLSVILGCLCVELPQAALTGSRESSVTPGFTLWRGLQVTPRMACVVAGASVVITDEVRLDNALEEVNRFSWGKGFVEARRGFLRCQTVSLYARVSVLIHPSSFLSRCKKWLLHPPPPPRLSLLWRDVEMHPPPTLDLAGNSLGWSREERSVYSRTHSERHTYTLIWREFGNMAANAGLPLHRPAVHSHSSQLQYISSVYGFC